MRRAVDFIDGPPHSFFQKFIDLHWLASCFFNALKYRPREV